MASKRCPGLDASVVLSAPASRTGAASAFTVGVDVGVLPREFVSMPAVSLVSLPVDPAVDVLRQGDRLKMRGIDATAVPTKVVELKSIGDRAYKQFVGEAMGGYLLGLDPEQPVSVWSLTGDPFPTSARTSLPNLRPEPFFGDSIHCTEEYT